ncbi:hypothetical protein N7471_008448 [Penicillium samsonianum]|uniref:uncharacterized protein n=1 Tax=Penicillium samsonianum TaxID=1882272 RepID=UPI00254699F6|nr:uncharacterized protein N7471_008448 [Penicillium samsonianum]KAJ6133233.1 hypothetical protein N7471_008448 [Penicillium samsonianum]
MDNHNFYFFSRLPTELRLAIWRECLPCRVIEIDQPFDELVFDLVTQTPCELRTTSATNRHPPLISRVCRESRLVASKAGHNIEKKAPKDSDWFSSGKFEKLWIDPSRDSIHLNWTPCYEPHFPNFGSALDRLAWNAAQVRGKGSFMLYYLDSDFDGDVKMEDRVGPVQELHHGAIVMRVIVVHTTFQDAARSGLFGHFGDAPIQIVDVSDELRIDAFFDFANQCESSAKQFITKRQDFHRDSAESIKATLREKLAERFGTQALPPMYPAIMFRFCPRWCNHSLKLSTNPRYPQEWR